MLNPALVIFNGRLLPFSETFIRAQAEGLKTFTPYYVGCRFVRGLSLPPERTLVVNNGNFIGKAKEGIFKSLGIAPQLYQQVKQLHPKMIHAHFGVCGALALPFARKLQVPLIVTFHGIDATMTDEYARKDSLSTRVYLHRRESLKRDTQLFVAVSNFLKSTLVNQGFPANRIIVHNIGIDTELFQPDMTVHREPIVLFVGRLVEKKGCEYLIKAMSEVQTVNPEIELVVIGDGELRKSLETKAKLTLKKYRFLGIQTPKVVRNWMNKAKVFCVPSIRAKSGDCEGFGLVFTEAQAMGLPVVSFASGGIPEAVAHNQTGFIVEEKDWQALGENILQLLDDPNLWQIFSETGYQRVRERFDLHKQNQALEEIYQNVIKSTC
ncbi:MAG: glycosyltransferase [Rivularia sp. (in: Bacteria)]|nr:glycosyltransferase [Rivularia sp. MS3]